MSRTPDRMRRIDLVVAVRDEELTLPEFVRAARALQLPQNVTLGFVFVEDSSRDATRHVLKQLAEEYEDLGYFCLARGYGQGPAIVFGLKQSRADAMIMLDGDGSHPLDAVPVMVRHWLDGADIVQCRRRELTGRRMHRRLGTELFHLFVRVLTGRDPDEQSIYYRLVSPTVTVRILATPRTWRYLRFPLESFSNGRVDVIDIDMRERVLGESKYGFVRLVDLAIVGILTQISPARLAGISALGLASAGVLGYAGFPFVAVIPTAAVVGLLLRYARLGDALLLQRMEVAESSETRGHAPLG